MAAEAVSAYINSVSHADMVFLPIAAGILLVHLWGLKVLPAIFISSATAQLVMNQGDLHWLAHAIATTSAAALSWVMFTRVLSGDLRFYTFKDLFGFIAIAAAVPIAGSVLIYIIITGNFSFSTIVNDLWFSTMPQLFYVVSLTVPILGLGCQWLQDHNMALKTNRKPDFHSFDRIRFNAYFASIEIMAATTFIGIYAACMCLSDAPWANNQLLPVIVSIIVLIRQGIPAAYTILLAIAFCGMICPTFRGEDPNFPNDFERINNLTVFCIMALAMGRFSSSHRSEQVQIQKRLQSMMDASVVSVVLVDTDMNVLKLNKTAAKDYQIGENLAQQARSRYLLLDENGKPLPPDIKPITDAVKSGKSLHNFHLKLQPKQGGHPVSWLLNCETVTPAAASQKGEALLMGIDITDHNQQQINQAKLLEQTRLTQKKHSLSLLTSGISRNFNNILAIIQGNLDLAAMDKSSPEATQKYLDEARKASVRAAELTRQLVLFTGNNQMTGQAEDINGIITQVTSELHKDLSERIILAFRPGENIPQINISKDSFILMLKQLLQNALESIGHKTGKIDISTETIDINAKSIANWHGAVITPENGSYVAINICDSGSGIDSTMVNQIFDPFFTTKSEANGLGLAMVFGITKSHNGAIKVDTAQDCGFTITVLLPAPMRGRASA